MTTILPPTFGTGPRGSKGKSRRKNRSSERQEVLTRLSELERSFEGQESLYRRLISALTDGMLYSPLGLRRLLREVESAAGKLDATTAGNERKKASLECLRTIYGRWDRHLRGHSDLRRSLGLTRKRGTQEKSGSRIKAGKLAESPVPEDPSVPRGQMKLANLRVWRQRDTKDVVSIRVSMLGEVSPLELSHASLIAAYYFTLLGLETPRLVASFAGSSHQKWESDVSEGEAREGVIEKAKGIARDVTDAARKKTNESRAAAAKERESNAKAESLKKERELKEIQVDFEGDPDVVNSRRRKEIAAAKHAEASAVREELAALRELGQLQQEFPHLLAEFLRKGNSITIGNDEVQHRSPVETIGNGEGSSENPDEKPDEADSEANG